MARIFLDGFESGGLDQFTSSSGAAVVSSSGLSMDGNYCLDLTGQLDTGQISISATGEIYTAFLYRATNNNSNLIAFFSGGSCVGFLHRGSSGVLSAYRSSTVLVSSAFAMSLATTYFVEVYFKLHDSSGRFVVKVNGIIVIDFTGDTNPSLTTFNSLIFGNAATGAASYGFAYYDNIILDTTNWIGKTYIQGLAVTGAGTTTQLTPSTGSNYACVDEIPASDTDYVYSNTVDQLDTYAAGNLTGTIGTIKAVQVQSRVVKEGTATPQNIKLAVRSGATDYVSADKVVPTTAATVAGIWETDPATSAAWSEANVNAVEIGVKTAA